jgi:peptidoglycan/LPS O-acetylase OafA/YrhL
VVGDALFSVNELVLGIDPFPSLADALYLPGYPVLAAGLTLLALSRSSGRRDWAGLTDAAIIAIGFGLLFSVLALSGASAAVTDGMYLAAYLLLGASGLHPSMAGLSEPSRRRLARLGRGRLLAMGRPPWSLRPC